MKSPFPGMDPYLEARWPTVHVNLCTAIQTTLQPALPAGLRARAQQSVRLVGPEPSSDQTFEPDVSVITPRSGGVQTAVPAAVTARPPLMIQVEQVIRDEWVEIIDVRNDNRLITAIEVLSPGNKAAGSLNRHYRRKLNSYLTAGVSVVEIDLIRSTRRRLSVTAAMVPKGRRARYYTRTCRGWDSAAWEVVPMPLRDPLPTVSIPCRRTDPDVPLTLQAVLDRVYADGGHDDIRYALPAEPPLAGEDAAWAAGVLTARRA